MYLLAAEAHVSRPPQGIERAVFYVSDRSADAELRDEPLVREVLAAEADKGASFYACDVRGIGESQPNTCGVDNVHTPYGSDYFYAIHSIMLDTPYLGQRTHDVLALIDWLESNGHKEIHLVAKGWGDFPAATIAALSVGFAPGHAGDAEECADVVCGSRRVGNVHVAAGVVRAGRAEDLRPARLLSGAGAEKPEADRAMGSGRGCGRGG